MTTRPEVSRSPSVNESQSHCEPIRALVRLTCIPELNIEYPEYVWYPGVLANASWSSEYLAHQLHKHIAEQSHSLGGDEIPIDELKKWINEELVVPGLGITDATEEELMAAALYPVAARSVLAKMISDRAQIGWSTHGHSAVDVNIYSSGGPGTDALRGNVENTDVGRFLREYLDVDVDAVTQELREKRDAAKRLGEQSESVVVEEMEFQPQTQDHWAAHEELEAHRLEEEEKAEAEEWDEVKRDKSL